MLDQYFVQECQLITETINEYGDHKYSSATTFPCRFREISTMRRQAHIDINDSDAMVWLPTNFSGIIGAVILFDGIYYRIERINKARRLGETEVQFIKCDLKIISIS